MRKQRLVRPSCGFFLANTHKYALAVKRAAAYIQFITLTINSRQSCESCPDSLLVQLITNSLYSR
ncbi:MAG: hypothetical protein ACKV2V_12775 [Blastocatellia bacterium]